MAINGEQCGGSFTAASCLHGPESPTALGTEVSMPAFQGQWVASSGQGFLEVPTNPGILKHLQSRPTTVGKTEDLTVEK